jgi:hypothetical protein
MKRISEHPLQRATIAEIADEVVTTASESVELHAFKATQALRVQAIAWNGLIEVDLVSGIGVTGQR